MESIKIENMLTLEETIAKDLFEGAVYPWEVLPKIGDFIMELGKTLPEEKFEKIGEDVWVAKSATIFPSAYIQGPAIIDEEADLNSPISLFILIVVVQLLLGIPAYIVLQYRKEKLKTQQSRMTVLILFILSFTILELYFGSIEVIAYISYVIYGTAALMDLVLIIITAIFKQLHGLSLFISNTIIFFGVVVSFKLLDVLTIKQMLLSFIGYFMVLIRIAFISVVTSKENSEMKYADALERLIIFFAGCCFLPVSDIMFWKGCCSRCT